MGIHGLLQHLKPVTKHVHLSEFAGRCAAVDALCWLHRGIYSCARELSEGKHSDRYLTFCMDRMQLLLQHSISVIFVFDGDRLQAKEGTEQDREKGRREARERGLQRLQRGDTKGGYALLAKSVDVTPEMCARLMRMLGSVGVPFLVAPYEADAQLGFLARAGVVDLVVSEDSDCLPYGCAEVLYKLDAAGGAQLVRLADVLDNPALGTRGFSHDMFVDACVLAGCDYAPSLRGVGVKTALKHIARHRSIERVVSALRREMRVFVPPTYGRDAVRARLTFRHQRVFDPRAGRLACVTPLPDALRPPVKAPADLAFLGLPVDDDTAAAVAGGALDPVTKQPYRDSAPVDPAAAAAVLASPLHAAAAAAEAEAGSAEQGPVDGDGELAPAACGNADARRRPHSARARATLARIRASGAPPARSVASTPMSRARSADTALGAGSRSITSFFSPQPARRVRAAAPAPARPQPGRAAASPRRSDGPCPAAPTRIAAAAGTAAASPHAAAPPSRRGAAIRARLPFTAPRRAGATSTATAAAPSPRLPESTFFRHRRSASPSADVATAPAASTAAAGPVATTTASAAPHSSAAPRRYTSFVARRRARAAPAVRTQQQPPQQPPTPQPPAQRTVNRDAAPRSTVRRAASARADNREAGGADPFARFAFGAPDADHADAPSRLAAPRHASDTRTPGQGARGHSRGRPERRESPHVGAALRTLRTPAVATLRATPDLLPGARRSAATAAAAAAAASQSSGHTEARARTPQQTRPCPADGVGGGHGSCEGDDDDDDPFARFALRGTPSTPVAARGLQAQVSAASLQSARSGGSSVVSRARARKRPGSGSLALALESASQPSPRDAGGDLSDARSAARSAVEDGPSARKARPMASRGASAFLQAVGLA